MDEAWVNNQVALCGICVNEPECSHRSRNEEYYIFSLEVARLSGNVDTINVILRDVMRREADIKPGDTVSVRGELRSFNNKTGKGSKLVITVFAKEIERGGEHENRVRLSGTLCQRPNYRRTPMGREICDMMLAVGRKYGRADYLPCIAWGQNARDLSETEAGCRLEIEGRIQSRKYIKIENDESLEKTAFEVSVIKVNIQ